MRKCGYEPCNNEVVGRKNKRFCSDSHKTANWKMLNREQWDASRNTPKFKKEQAKRVLNYINKRNKEDVLFRLTGNARGLVNGAFKTNGYSKDTKTHNALGCSFEELKAHLESGFVDGMSWDNYGDWHIDHIIPISWAKSKDEVFILSYYENLQPLWAFDNVSKGNRFVG